MPKSPQSRGFDLSFLRHSGIGSTYKKFPPVKIFCLCYLLIFSGLLMVGDFLQQKREKKKFDYERFVLCSKPLRFLNQNLVISSGFPRAFQGLHKVQIFIHLVLFGLTKCMSKNHKIEISRDFKFAHYTPGKSPDHQVTIPHVLKSCTRPVLWTRIHWLRIQNFSWIPVRSGSRLLTTKNWKKLTAENEFQLMYP